MGVFLKILLFGKRSVVRARRSNREGVCTLNNLIFQLYVFYPFNV